MKAGYENSTWIIKSLDWLLNTRQSDGGWALPFRTRGDNLSAFEKKNTIDPDHTKPSSHMVTGMVLRALAAHPEYRRLDETKKAGQFLADSIFTSDAYADRRGVEYWTRFAYPFVYTDIVSALDSLSIIGGYGSHHRVREALTWLEAHQTSKGLFDIHITRGNKQISAYWLSIAICRIYKRTFE